MGTMSGGQITVLLADDNLIVREGVRALLGIEAPGLAQLSYRSWGLELASGVSCEFRWLRIIDCCSILVLARSSHNTGMTPFLRKLLGLNWLLLLLMLALQTTSKAAEIQKLFDR